MSVFLTLACSVSVANQTTVINNLASVSATAIPTSKPTTTVVTPICGLVMATALEVRQGPGEQYNTLAWLRHGAMVIVTGNLDPATENCTGWLQTTNGYVCGEFVKIKDSEK